MKKTLQLSKAGVNAIPVKILQQRRKLLIKYFIQSVSNFNIKTFLRQNKPRQ